MGSASREHTGDTWHVHDIHKTHTYMDGHVDTEACVALLLLILLLTNTALSSTAHLFLFLKSESCTCPSRNLSSEIYNLHTRLQR